MLRHAADVAHEAVGIGKDAGIHLLHDIPFFCRGDKQREIDMPLAVGAYVRHFSLEAESVRRGLISLCTFRHGYILRSLLLLPANPRGR